MNVPAKPATMTSGGVIGFFRHPIVARLGWAISGLGILAALWLVFGYYIEQNPDTRTFSKFGLIPTLKAFPELLEIGKLQTAVAVSMHRLSEGLLIAVIVGIPLGILVGRKKRFRELTNSPFQFIRMVSPLSWMPIVVYVFSEWHGSIVFLLAIAAVWPVMFSTAAGLAKVDPAWFMVARNLGARPMHMLTRIIIPAITFDILSGLRLALGVAWIVLIPAEYLGVTTGLGYSIQDSRETLSYDHLTAIVVTIGVIGYTLDTLLVVLIRRFSWHRG